MNRFSVLVAATAFLVLFALGCAGTGNPVLTDNGLDAGGLTAAASRPGSQTHLWGYFDVAIDPAKGTVEAVSNRQAMFTANVTNFLNSKPAAMTFKINGITPQAGYTDVDIDVSLTHPFPGLPQYNGYDVRGIFMGDGSASMSYNPDLIYPVLDTDQYMLADSVDGFGGPDGYSRWFNITEFSTGGMPLLQYTKGKLATPGFNGSATLCPYKYFADGLGATDDLWTWLKDNPGLHGQFASGATNTRDYYLRFPTGKGVTYGYAVIANWEGTDPSLHPSNTTEAVGCKIDDASSLFYVDASHKGGNLTLDIGVFDWGSMLSGGVMQDYKIYIESPVLSSVHEFSTSEMTPVGGGTNYSTYHVDLPGTPTQSGIISDNWIVVEYPGHDYTNEFGVPNLADTDPLAAFFRFDVNVSPTEENLNPICDLQLVTTMPAENWSPVAVEFDASGSSDPNGDILTFAWDFDGDGDYGEAGDDSYKGPSSNPTHGYASDYSGTVWVKVTDGKGGEATCSVDVDVIAHPSKNLPLRDGVQANDLAIDQTNGDLLVMFSDNAVWKYARSSWYQSGSQFYSTALFNTHLRFIEESPNQHTIIVGDYAYNNPLSTVLDPAGSELYAMSQGGPDYPNVECFTITSGDFLNALGNILGWPPNNATFAIRYPDGDWFYGHQWHYYWPGVYTGLDQIYYGYIKGVESDKNGNFLWYLEDAPEFYATRWKLSTSGFPYSQTYDNAYFGTGAQTDADNGFYSGRDITRDDQNRYFILDRLSTGQPRTKMWTVNGNVTTSKGGFGDSTSISATPLRIEGSEFSGDVVVLHGDTPPYMISVFVPFEMP